MTAECRHGELRTLFTAAAWYAAAALAQRGANLILTGFVAPDEWRALRRWRGSVLPADSPLEG